MTLSPVFRSPEALGFLSKKGYLSRLDESVKAQRESILTITGLLKGIIDPEYLHAENSETNDIEFFQEHFFLILFHSIFQTLNCPKERLYTYTLLNQCIKGLIVSGDNLFDKENKMILPLRLNRGRCFGSIIQMLCFDQLITRILENHGAWLSKTDSLSFRRSLLSKLTFIGTLEGSEEDGVSSVLPVETMIEKVHKVRGGALFSLAFVAPHFGEKSNNFQAFTAAEAGISCIGTAFQIVDDLTDFEFDLHRASHNILVAQITHKGTDQEREALRELQSNHNLLDSDTIVEEKFMFSANGVLDLAIDYVKNGFRTLQSVGFWFPPDDAEIFVLGIVGTKGESRIRDLLAKHSGH
jgi:hypothetical protein